MSLSNPLRERRRGARVHRALPLTLYTGSRALAVRTVDVGDHGALVVSPEPLDSRFGVVLANPATDRRAPGRVVRCATGETPGEFEVAVEFLEPFPAFWGDGAA